MEKRIDFKRRQKYGLPMQLGKYAVESLHAGGMMKTALTVLLFSLLLLSGFSCVGSEKPDDADDNAGGDDDTISEPDFAHCSEWLASSWELDVPDVACSAGWTNGYDGIREDIRDIGGGIFPIGNNRYFIAWFPEDWEEAENRTLVISLHGSCDCPEDIWQGWYEMSPHHSYALMALQFLDPSAIDLEEADDVLIVYKNLETIIELLQENCPVDGSKTFLYGLSRGSILSFSLAVLDRAESGLGAFTAFISDSGAWRLEYPPPWAIQNVIDSDDREAFSGARFWMYYGLMDPSPLEQAERMENAKQFVEDYGGVVDRLFVDPEGIHGMFSKRLPKAQPTEAVLELFEYMESF